MRYLEPNVVVVDDKIEEITGILKYFGNLGLGCKYFNSDQFEGDIYPTKCYSDVNLFFLDLYYSEMPFDAEKCANWVQSVIPSKSFYILVLWTRDPANAESVQQELAKHDLIPYCCLVKVKNDFRIEGDGLYDYSRLFEDLERELENLSALDEIQVWKKSVKLSSNIVLGHLTKNSDPIVFNEKLKKIIIRHGGISMKTNANFQRKRLILFDALDSILISNTKRNIIDDTISDVNIQNLYNLENFEDPGIDKELNSWFHFKLEKNLPNELIYPGLLCSFKQNDWKTLYSIHDDPIIMEYIREQTERNVRISSIALLISRPCDIAQTKYGKNLKLISGLKFINPLRKENIRKEFKKSSSNVDSVKIYDHLYFSEEENDITLLFDFRYSFSIPENVFRTEFTNLKIFNKELLSEMQVEYSSYSSRLGITEII